MAPQEKNSRPFKSQNFNPIAMVRKEEQQAYFKTKIFKLSWEI
jgi:hypothetical protein